MGSLLPAIKQCAGDQVGIANFTLVVKNDGTVQSVLLAGVPFAGTPQGTCMEGVVRRAQFPPFSSPTFRVTYPASIR
jgi:hypothetical protein